LLLYFFRKRGNLRNGSRNAKAMNLFVKYSD
jgi:hypothetical protein